MKHAIQFADETAEMRAAIERVLGEHFGREIRVEQFERRPFEYSTSFALDSIAVSLDDGRRLDLLVKDLNRSRMQPEAVNAKPDFLHDSLREIEVYRHILAQSQIGTACCYGAAVDAERGRYWLFLERVRGRELYQIGDRELWKEVARWLARMHSRFATSVDNVRRLAPLLRYDSDFYRAWLCRARIFQANKLQAGDAERWQSLIDSYEAVIERLVTLPRTLIHGEFYASNVVVEESREPIRVCPIDWETAAIGPGLIDLAAFTSGNWTDAERVLLVEAYWTELDQCDEKRTPLDQLLTDLDYCRLHVAMQWLGWSPNWTPPADHAHNWLNEAIELAERIGL